MRFKTTETCKRTAKGILPYPWDLILVHQVRRQMLHPDTIKLFHRSSTRGTQQPSKPSNSN